MGLDKKGVKMQKSYRGSEKKPWPKVMTIWFHQHKKYLEQQRIIGFLDEPTFLFAGYIPDQAWTSLSGIYLACWNGDVLEWYDEAGKYSYEQFSIDFDPSRNDAHKIIEKRVRLKKGLGKNKDKETGTDNH